MRAVVQRVERAAVRVAGDEVAAIGPGLLALVAVERGDEADDAARLADRLAGLRCFPGRTPMDEDVATRGGAVLLVSQFTLAASLGKGRRPSFERAAPPSEAVPLLSTLAAALRDRGLEVAEGRFGADMQVSLVNDGPVTFVLRVRGGRLVEDEEAPGA